MAFSAEWEAWHEKSAVKKKHSLWNSFQQSVKYPIQGKIPCTGSTEPWPLTSLVTYSQILSRFLPQLFPQLQDEIWGVDRISETFWLWNSWPAPSFLEGIDFAIQTLHQGKKLPRACEALQICPQTPKDWWQSRKLTSILGNEGLFPWIPGPCRQCKKFTHLSSQE